MLPEPPDATIRRWTRYSAAETLQHLRAYAGRRSVIATAIHFEKLRSRPRPAVLDQLRAWL